MGNQLRIELLKDERHLLRILGIKDLSSPSKFYTLGRNLDIASKNLMPFRVDINSSSINC
jgi:hypothetical protein